MFALGACSTPEQNTNLRPEGPPEVLAVLVATDAVGLLYEEATYCAPDDEKRPSIVGLPDFTSQQICDDDLAVTPAPVTSAYPDGWYIRIMFDELLDPSVEELTEILDPDTGEGTDTYTGSIATTNPVTLECESVAGGFVNVPYDGYYSPAGNAVTWPLGPSLVIQPIDPTVVATGKNCRVTINESVVDKSGDPIPAEQRGPFPFALAAIEPIYIDPPDGSNVDPFYIWSDNVYVQFNTAPDEASFCDEGVGMDECEFTFGPELDAGGLYAYSLEPFGFTATEFGFGPNDPARASTEYTFAFKEGGKIADRCGVETTLRAPAVNELTQTTFMTNPFGFTRTLPSTGDTTPAVRKVSIGFNNVLDDTLLDPADFVLTQGGVVVPTTLTTSTGADVLVAAHLAPATEYVFTLADGAVITDAYGATYTQAGARTITWTTQPIALSAASVVGNGTQVRLSFNQSMDPLSLDPTEYEISGGLALAAPTASGCAEDSTSCQLRLATVAAPALGDYTFTLKDGATIDDVLGNTYTQVGDRVIEFTVEDVVTPTPHVCL